MDWVRRAGGGTNRRPLLKSEIEEAQRNTKSGAEAARWLGVSYLTYRKYAKLYGIFEQHKNPGGKGMLKPHKRGYSNIPLEEILKGEHPNYDVRRLRKRLIKSGVLDEVCALCGFSERRVLDYRVPLMLVYKDGDSRNHRLENLLLLCFNCAFLTTGNLNNVNPHKVKTLSKPEPEAVAGEEAEGLPIDRNDWESIIEEAKRELEEEDVGR